MMEVCTASTVVPEEARKLRGPVAIIHKLAAGPPPECAV